MILEQSNGYDISLKGAATNTATVDIQGLDTDLAAAGASGQVAGSGGTYATVGGQVTFESGKSFSVVSSTNVVDTASGTSALSAVSDVNISSQKGANDAMSVLDNALAFVDDLRAEFGAVQNRFTSTINNLQTTAENISDARSRIQDADFAKETGNLSRAQILQQAGTAMLAQANQAQQSVLQLLG